jgi:hypothetical protein
MNISQHLFNFFKVLVKVFQAGLIPLSPCFENKPESQNEYYFPEPIKPDMHCALNIGRINSSAHEMRRGFRAEF